MKALGFTKFGEPEVFEELELPKPKASEKGVLIKVQAVGINPYDALLRAGTMQKIRPLEFPIVPGSDIVGKIVEVGSKVKNYAIGDVVIAHPAIGGYAEYVATPSYNVVKKPKEMGVEEAAGLASAGITAYYALQIANVKKGENLVIQGASGAVGAIIVQLAKEKGIRVIGIGNSKNADYLSALGVDRVMSYDRGNLAEILKDKGDVVIDASFGGKGAEEGLHYVKKGGRYISLTALPENAEEKQVKAIRMKRTKEMKDKEALGYLADLYRANKLQLKTAEVLTFDLRGVIGAHQLIEKKNVAGKIILK
ncbi:NADP-dependent oxidoreductase [Listeria weihenstephanensis]|uniref:NADP-dependent oxidoreductase n=1 Tax=Listeria weihenstephanensis TaxID=1006155 RepID=A0A841Z772_9LIST|nr:NADP-dependent oxidoreductase [Listeria weihenstephanensis]MBC1500719.1 NADP-dependent oxidoreductase [Listeria weihenstephanensis]